MIPCFCDPESATRVGALQTCVTVTLHDQAVPQVWVLLLQLHPEAEAVCEYYEMSSSPRIIGKYYFTTRFNWKPQPLCATKKKCSAEVFAFNFFKLPVRVNCERETRQKYFRDPTSSCC